MASEKAKQISYKTKYPESWERLSLVNQTAGQLQSLWLGFLSFGAFLAATAVSVTHRDLFLGSPVKLPFLSVELPMLSFFIAAPVLFLLFHFYVLAKYRLLLETLKNFRHLHPQSPDKILQQPNAIEMHLTTSLVLRAATHQDQNQNNFFGLLKTLLPFSLALFPISVLLLIQLKFIAYQNTLTTFLHGTALIIAIMASASAVSKINQSGRMPLKRTLIIFTIFITITPTLFRDYVVREGVGIPSYVLYFTRLNPAKRDFVDNKIFEDQDNRVDISLTGRNFTGANLEYADLRGIDFRNSDFSYAKLLSAKLDYAVLRETNFSFADMQLASLFRAQMNDAILIGTNLFNAEMVRTNMNKTRLRCANLEGAHLDAAVLRDAHLVRANLNDTRLIGANLKRANLAGAYLGAATFRGTNLKDTNFIGAAFTYEDLKQLHHIARETKPRGLQYCKKFRQINKGKIDKPEYKDLIKNSAPIFAGANFRRTKVDSRHLLNSIHCATKEPHLIPNPGPFDFHKCQIFTEGSALKRYKFLEDFIMQFGIWKDKLKLRGLKIERTKVDRQLNTHILVSKKPNRFETRNTICFAGFYPHTAIGMIQAGLLYKRPRISQYVLENRCKKSCPGARDLDPDSLGKLWRSARNGKIKTDSKIDFGPHELPDVAAKCDLWSKFNSKSDAPQPFTTGKTTLPRH